MKYKMKKSPVIEDRTKSDNFYVDGRRTCLPVFGGGCGLSSIPNHFVVLSLPPVLPDEHIAFGALVNLDDMRTICVRVYLAGSRRHCGSQTQSMRNS